MTLGEPVDIDLRGLKCPLPALKVNAALRRLPPGGLLRARATDPLAGIDIPHLVRARGDDLLAVESDGSSQIFLIRKAAGAGDEAKGTPRGAAGTTS